MISVAGILVSLVLLMYLAYRNHNVIVIAPICALVAVGLDGELPLLAVYTQIFLDSLGKFIVRYFALFLLGAIFGKLMEETDSAAAIAEWILRWVGTSRALLALVLTCAVLTYGGVSLFVVVFTVFPLAVALFRQANLPRRLIPASIALGAFTFTMTALPGSVQIQNLIPMPFFKTTSFAAPVMGCTAALIMFSVGMLWLNYRAMRSKEKGEGFCVELDLPQQPHATTSNSLPPISIALMPLVILLILNFVFSQLVVPNWDANYLGEPRFGATELKKVQGTWSTILAMAGAILCIVAVHWRKASELKEIVSRGAQSSLMPVFNAASEFGYGSTIAALAGFEQFRGFAKTGPCGFASANQQSSRPGSQPSVVPSLPEGNNALLSWPSYALPRSRTDQKFPLERISTWFTPSKKPVVASLRYTEEKGRSASSIVPSNGTSYSRNQLRIRKMLLESVFF